MSALMTRQMLDNIDIITIMGQLVYAAKSIFLTPILNVYSQLFSDGVTRFIIIIKHMSNIDKLGTVIKNASGVIWVLLNKAMIAST